MGKVDEQDGLRWAPRLEALRCRCSHTQRPGRTPTTAEKQRPELVEKVGLTAEQADKVIEINYETRMKAATELKDLNEADRKTKLAELMAAKEKKFAEFLTAEQITAMNKYYEEKRKNMPRKAGS